MKRSFLLSLFATVCFAIPFLQAAPPEEGADGEDVIGPDYTDAPELKPAEGVPRGTVHLFAMQSTDSKIYPGLKGPYTRKCAVYVPAQYKAGSPVPFIVVQDGMGEVNRLAPALDSLIAAKKLPVIAAVFINSGGGDGKGSERGLEYDTVSEAYSKFVETEVLPLAAKEGKVTFTTDPEGRAVMGASSGAACAFTMAWFRPDLYRRVLSYSGTYVDQQSPKNAASPHGAWEYHEHLIPQNPAKPIRIWLHVSENDNGPKKDEASLHNWVMANQRMAAALKAKGYHYRYVFSKASGHVDGRVVKQTLPGALLWLWHGYTPKP
ncbi:MAG TPA: alpha/beta hydrolase-fold protein [Verrucomicrobiales bacterium]|nr:alpha/beta hydrolase-fold protein [Verrucomicrobiales bacterium]